MIESQRLILRQWHEQDRRPFAELNSDLSVMEFFPSTLTRGQSDTFIDKAIKQIRENKWGLFATEIKDTGEFIGFIGLSVPTYKTHFTPCTEIGWRLHKNFWGNGYATEGAQAIINFAFNDLKLKEVVSFTPVLNLPSIAVMKRIGMKLDHNGEFDHPKVESGDKLCKHVLYRIQNE